MSLRPPSGGGAGGGGAQLHASRSVNTATAAFENILTLAAAPHEESLQIHIDGLLKRPGVDYTVAGQVVTLTPGLVPGAVVVDSYLTETATPGESALSGNTAPVIRGATINSGGGSTLVALPAGSEEDDIAILYAFNDGTEGVPAPSGITGWTQLQTSSLWGGQGTWWKQLTAADITAGGVTVSGGGNVMGAVATGVGTSAALIAHSRAGQGSTNTSGLASGAALAMDRVFWLSGARTSGDAPAHSRPGTDLAVRTGLPNFSGRVRQETVGAAGTIGNEATTSASAAVISLAGVAIRG